MVLKGTRSLLMFEYGFLQYLITGVLPWTLKVGPRNRICLPHSKTIKADNSYEAHFHQARNTKLCKYLKYVAWSFIANIKKNAFAWSAYFMYASRDNSTLTHSWVDAAEHGSVFFLLTQLIFKNTTAQSLLR